MRPQCWPHRHPRPLLSQSERSAPASQVTPISAAITTSSSYQRNSRRRLLLPALSPLATGDLFVYCKFTRDLQDFQGCSRGAPSTSSASFTSTSDDLKGAHLDDLESSNPSSANYLAIFWQRWASELPDLIVSSRKQASDRATCSSPWYVHTHIHLLRLSYCPPHSPLYCFR